MANNKGTVRKAVDEAWMLTGAQTWWSAMSEYNSEVLDFISNRFAKDSRTMRELNDCQNWNEISDLQTKWLQEALKDYSAEATKLMTIYAKQSADAAQEKRIH